MDVNCKKCGKLHTLSNSAVENKKVFFYCNGCGQKIIIDNRKGHPEKEGFFVPRLTIKDILNGVSRSVNLSAFLLGLIFGLFALILVYIVAMLFFKNMSFFISHYSLSFFLGFIFILFLYFSYNLLLYLHSKIYFFKIKNNDNKIDWKYIFVDWGSDSLALFLISGGFIILFIAFLIPISLLKSYGLIYSGLFFLIFIVSAVFLIIHILLINFIPAFIASKSLFVMDFFKELYSFIKKECLNLPFYLIIIEVVTNFFYFIMLLIMSLAFFLSGFAVFSLLDPGLKGKLVSFLPALQSNPMQGLTASMPGEVKGGIILLGLGIILFCLILWSIYITLKQALYSQACFIMQSNPRKSISRKQILFALIMFFCLILIFCIFILFNIKIK